MMNIYEKVRDIIFCLALGIVIVWGLSFRNEYRVDTEQADTERAAYLELSRNTVDAINSAEESIGRSVTAVESVETRLESVETGIAELKAGTYESGDLATAVGITSDENIRLIRELSKRLSETSTE